MTTRKPRDKRPPKPPPTPEELLRAYFGQMRKGKSAYRKADELMKELQRAVGVGVPIDLGGEPYQIIDRYEKDDTVFRPVSFCRYGIESVRPESATVGV